MNERKYTTAEAIAHLEKHPLDRFRAFDAELYCDNEGDYHYKYRGDERHFIPGRYVWTLVDKRHTTLEAMAYLLEHQEARFEAPECDVWKRMSLYLIKYEGTDIATFMAVWAATSTRINGIPHRNDWTLQST